MARRAVVLETGGCPHSEELRDRLLERFEVVYSGYGATDLEIGMAGESPVTVALRRLARARPDVRAALFVFGSREEVERIERYHAEDTGDGELDLPLFQVRGLFRDPMRA